MSLPGVINAKSKGPADPIRAALEANARLFAVCFAFAAAMSILALTVSFYMLEVYDRVLNSRSLDARTADLDRSGGVAVHSALDSLRLRLLIRAGMRVAKLLNAQVLRAMIALSARAGSAVARQGLRDIDTTCGFDWCSLASRR